MKSLVLLRTINTAFLSAVITASSAFAFEGSVQMKSINEKGHETPVTYQIKGSNVRVDMTVANERKKTTSMISVIKHMDTKEAHMVMHDQKMYLPMTMPDVAQTVEEQTKKMQFKPTGRKERIAGIEAEEFVGETEGKRTEVWVTKELGPFVSASQGSPFSRQQATPKGWEAFAKGKDFFPLRVIERRGDDRDRRRNRGGEGDLARSCPDDAPTGGPQIVQRGEPRPIPRAGPVAVP